MKGISSRQPFTEYMVSSLCIKFVPNLALYCFSHRQVSRSACLHSKADQQHLLQFHLRDRETQRGGGAAGDLRFNHQRLCLALEGGAQDLSTQGEPAPRVLNISELLLAASPSFRSYCPSTKFGPYQCTTRNLHTALFNS